MPKKVRMNISNIVGALFPIFFVLALGYLAGKRHTFDGDQAAGFSKLALSFALPASLFVSMTGIPRDLLLGQGRLVLCIDSFACRSFPYRLDRT
jgi:malonate transporter and related proteins